MSVESTQRKVLKKFLKKAKKTAFGKEHTFDSIASYEDYKNAVPLRMYSDYIPYFEKIKAGEHDVIWPGHTTRYAMTAGSTGDPKIIPLSMDRLKTDSRFMRRVIRDYLFQHPNLDVLTGHHMSIPGNLKTPDDMPGTLVGEVSAHLATFAPKWLHRFQLLNPNEVVFLDLQEKLEVAVERSLEKDVRVIYALPSWTLKFLQMVLERHKVDTLDKIWPKLRLFVSGGESLASCKDQILRACGTLKPDFIENYGSSEGFYSYTKKINTDDMKLCYDLGVFYEFIENPSADPTELVNQKTIPLWEVQEGKTYALVVTSDAGLWRYCMTDVVKFTNAKNPHIKMTGRVTDVVDKFGESISLFQIETALRSVCEEFNAEYISYSVGGLMMKESGIPKHLWFVQWSKEPENVEAFTNSLDKKMIEINHSYEIRRLTNAISAPLVIGTTQKQKDLWMQENFRIGAQTKFPRIIHDDTKINNLLKICEEELV